MAVIYRTSLKTTRMQAVVTDIDSGAGAGELVIGTAGMGSTLAVLALNDPCGSVAGSILTFDVTPQPSATASGSGTAAAAIIRESGGATVVSGLTVGTSGTDIIITSTTINSGDTVTMTAGTLTHG